MSADAADAAERLRRRLGEAGALVAAGREALDAGRLPDFGRLAPMIEELTRDVARLPEGRAARSLRPSLLALVDEIARLGERLAAERDRLGARLRDSGAHRRAGAAYRRTGGA